MVYYLYDLETFGLSIWIFDEFCLIHNKSQFYAKKTVEKMSAIKKGLAYSSYQHSPKVTERRRSLFPTNSRDSEDESDLGHISPLNFDSSFENEDLKQLSGKPVTINDYDILGIVENDDKGTVCTPSNNKHHTNSEIMSPLYLSPHPTTRNSSPSCILKTPHDTCNTNCKLPKLVRKSLLDSADTSSNKRKLSPYNSPKQESKQIKLDPKSSKVRTTLFPEDDMSVPVKSFYPKSVNIMEKILQRKKLVIPSPVKSTANRRLSNRRKRGEINAGVQHKIRKPKQRKMTKIKSMNPASSLALTEYILTLKEMQSFKKEEQSRLIADKENKSPKTCTQEKVNLPVEVGTKSESPVKRVSNSEAETNQRRFSSKPLKPTGAVSVTENIEEHLHEKPTGNDNSRKKPLLDFDPNDFTMDEPSMLSENIEDIISKLDDSHNKILLEVHDSVLATDNSILLHKPPLASAADLILSPISQMCDVTSGLALNSPKRVKNLNIVLDAMPNASYANNVSRKSAEDKLYPVFSKESIKFTDKKSNNRITVTNKRKFAKIDGAQMMLDAGQKKFGWCQCPECNFVYHLGDPSDEMVHMNYHDARHILRFNGWRNERVVGNFQNMGRMVQILPGDPKSWIKRANDMMTLINNELGIYKAEIDPTFNGQIYLYIQSRLIVGCILAVPKDLGCKMLTTSEGEIEVCSEETYPVKCGIARIWVSRNHRKQGIATAMLDTVKKNFMFGNALKNSDIAMSSPTEEGIKFATNYFKTPNFLIYLI